MGLLSRILKTPDPDADEVQDEFQAEESGLLMASSPPAEEAADAPPEPGADTASEAAAEMPPEAESEAPTAEGGAESPSQEEGEPSEAAEDAAVAEPEAQIEPPPSEPEEDSSGDPLAAFRSTAGQHGQAQAIQADLVDVPVEELLGEARSIRDALSAAARGGHLPEEAEQEAA